MLRMLQRDSLLHMKDIFNEQPGISQLQLFERRQISSSAIVTCCNKYVFKMLK